MSLTPIKIIISARAGAAAVDNEKLCEQVSRIFTENRIDVDLSLAHSGAELNALALDAARGPYKVIVAGGGDGTVTALTDASGRDVDDDLGDPGRGTRRASPR